jgi:hypothetical protein
VKILLCLTLNLCWASTTASGIDSYGRKTEAPHAHEVTGSLTELDLAKGKAMLRTDLGRSVFLDVRKPELFKNLSVGDRVTIQMGEDGQVDKVMGVKVPERAINGQPVPLQP